MQNPIKVNRAAVLTLWATVVAERLGYAPDLALTLGWAVADINGRSKSDSLKCAQEAQRQQYGPRPVWLLGYAVLLAVTEQGALRAEKNGRPTSAAWVQWYLEKMFQDRLPEVRATMEAAANTITRDELDRVGFRIYEAFRLELPVGAQGSRTKGVLSLESIRATTASITDSAKPRTAIDTGKIESEVPRDRRSTFDMR